jgi:cysteine synthase
MGGLLPSGSTVCADPALGFPGMFDKVEQLRKQLPNVHVLNQVTNKANSEAHFRLTGMDTIACVRTMLIPQ